MNERHSDSPTRQVSNSPTSFRPRGPSFSPRGRSASLSACDLRVQHNRIASVLLHDRQEAGVEEADLEQHQKRHRPVDAVRQRVEHRGREIQAEGQLDERLHGDRLAIVLSNPLVRVAFDAVFRRARANSLCLLNSASKTAFELLMQSPMPIDMRNGRYLMRERQSVWISR